MLQICCKNNNIYKEFPVGSSLLEIYSALDLDFPYQVVSARVNNRSEGLNFRVYNNKDVEFLDVRNPSGMRTYVRSLCFVLYKAVSELFPQGKLYVEHPVSKGYFCNLRIGRPIELEDVQAIKLRMQEIIAEDIPFHRIECHVAEAARIFSERGMNDKVKLLETSGELYTYYYKLGDTVDYYYGNLLPSTGFIKLFDIVKYYDGLLLRIPSKENPNVLEDVVKQEKMLDVFKEHLRWNHIMGLSNVGDFNHACEDGHATDLIKVAEALQEKKIAQIADDIYHRGDGDRGRFLAHSLRAAIRQAFPDRLPPKFHICVLAYEHIYGPGRRFLDHDNLELKHCQDVLEAAFLTNDTSALCSAFQCSHRGERNATRIWVLPAEAFPKWLESHRESWAGPPET